MHDADNSATNCEGLKTGVFKRNKKQHIEHVGVMPVLIIEFVQVFFFFFSYDVYFETLVCVFSGVFSLQCVTYNVTLCSVTVRILAVHVNIRLQRQNVIIRVRIIIQMLFVYIKDH